MVRPALYVNIFSKKRAVTMVIGVWAVTIVLVTVDDFAIRKHLISSPDLVLEVRGQKNGGGGRGRERRKRDLAKYESKRALIGCSTMHAKAPRVCYFYRSQCQKHAKEVS